MNEFKIKLEKMMISIKILEINDISYFYVNAKIVRNNNSYTDYY